MEHADNVGGGWVVDDGGGNDLVHCFVVCGVRWVVDHACAAAVDGAGEERHADAALVGDVL